MEIEFRTILHKRCNDDCEWHKNLSLSLSKCSFDTIVSYKITFGKVPELNSHRLNGFIGQETSNEPLLKTLSRSFSNFLFFCF